MWLLMADQLQKGNINHPALMLKKGAEEQGVKKSAEEMPSMWAKLAKG